MKRYFKTLSSLVFLLLLTFSWNSCDSLNSLALNIPFSINVELKGTGTSLSDTEPACLTTESDTYEKYSNKINSLKFVAAAFRTISVSPSNLSGDITIKLLNDSGDELFSYTKYNATPADFIKPNLPFILQLTQNQIDFINYYLDDVLHGGACFTAIVSVDNLNGNPPYTLKGAIDMVIEADTKL